MNILYTNAARFDTGRSLTETEMRQMAPSIFAVAKHDSRSDRFQPIPTIEILRGLAKEGFVPVGARQSTTRDPGKAPFTKHLLRLRKLDNTHKVGDTVLEMLLKNANDGTSAYDLMAGLFRICCLNSMVAQTGTIDTIKVRHSGDVMTKVIEGTYRVLTQAETVMAAPQDWVKARLNREEGMALAEAAHMIRFGEPEEGQQATFDPAALLKVRRQEDRDPNLWTVFNVVQENVIKGGVKGIAYNPETGVRRRQTTRPVTGIDQDVKLNKALWVLGQRMAELKGVAIAA